MSFESIRQALLEKTAESMETNVDDKTVGFEDVHKNPPGRAVDTIDAPWGEPGPKDPFHNSSAVWDAFKDDRELLLDRVFTQFGPSAKADQKLVSENFQSPGKPGSYETHSALLNHGLNLPSLTERVKAVVGRR